MINIKREAGFCLINVKAVPNAKKTQLAGEYNGALKVKVAAVPEDGKANDEIVDFFSDVFDINKSQIEIVKGFKSRHKVIKLTGIEEEKFKKILA
jgi:hypothetical protein